MGRRWWWLVAAAVVLGLVLVVAQPWADVETEPPILPTSPPAPETSSAPVPEPTPSATPSDAATEGTAPDFTGSDAVFDDASMRRLFVQRVVVQGTVPAASDGLRVRTRPGDVPWGMAEGDTVKPAACTTAVTVVAERPPGFVSRSDEDTDVVFAQSVTRLDDAAAATSAFADLVETVDRCPTYREVDAAGPVTTYTTEAAVEGQDPFPTIVQEVVVTRPDEVLATYRGYLLVGNTIVSWSAAARHVDPDDVGAALATLGTPEALSAMMQTQALAAVQAVLSPPTPTAPAPTAPASPSPSS